MKYKIQNVSQWFSQRLGIDFDETYSYVINTIIFWFFIGLSKERNLKIFLMDVVTSYLYRPLDTDIFMKIPKWIKVFEINKTRKLYIH